MFVTYCCVNILLFFTQVRLLKIRYCLNFFILTQEITKPSTRYYLNKKNQRRLVLIDALVYTGFALLYIKDYYTEFFFIQSCLSLHVVNKIQLKELAPTYHLLLNISIHSYSQTLFNRYSNNSPRLECNSAIP